MLNSKFLQTICVSFFFMLLLASCDEETKDTLPDTGPKSLGATTAQFSYLLLDSTTIKNRLDSGYQTFIFQSYSNAIENQVADGLVMFSTGGAKAPVIDTLRPIAGQIEQIAGKLIFGSFTLSVAELKSASTDSSRQTNLVFRPKKSIESQLNFEFFEEQFLGSVKPHLMFVLRPCPYACPPWNRNIQ